MESLTPHLAATPAKAPAAALPRSRRLRKFAKRAGFFGVFLLAILLVIFFMLPVWMSNEQGRNYVLSRINKKINGTVAVESWRLGWFSGTEVKNLTVTLPDGKVILTCPRIQTELTLWSLLWSNFDLGNTRLDSPQVTAAKYADGSTDFSRLLLPKTGAPANPFHTLRGNIVCRNGYLDLTSPRAGTPLLIHEITAEIPIASHTAPIHLRANGLTAGVGASQPVTLVADLPGPVTWPDNPYALLGSVQVRAGNVPTAALAEWLNLDPRWDQSLGATLTTLAVTSEPLPDAPATSLVSVALTGTGGTFGARFVMAVTPASPAVPRDRLVLTLVDQKDPSLVARVRLSPPLTNLLTHVNPLLAGVESADDAFEVNASALSLDLLDPATAAGRLLARLPGMTLRPTPLLAMIHALAPPAPLPPPPPAGAPETATVNLLNLTLADGRTACNDFVLTLNGRQRLTFSGSVGFDGTLDLVLRTPLVRPFLTTTLRAPITGTLANPVLEKP